MSVTPQLYDRMMEQSQWNTKEIVVSYEDYFTYAMICQSHLRYQNGEFEMAQKLLFRGVPVVAEMEYHGPPIGIPFDNKVVTFKGIPLVF